MAAWWQQFPLTQTWSPPSEQGEDVATPFHTPLPPPLPGKVTRTRYGPFGGEVDIAAKLPGSGQSVTEYILHEDQIFVHPGDVVDTSTITGLSGGQLSGGSHPATSQYSSGPHTEVGFWTGAPWTSQSLDPASILSSINPTGPRLYGMSSGTVNTGATASPDVNTDIKVASLPIIGDITIPTDALWRGGLIILGIIIVLIGLVVMLKGPAKMAISMTPQGAAANALSGGGPRSVGGSSGAGSTWGAGGREVTTQEGENRSDSFIKGFYEGGRTAAPKMRARR